MKNTRIVVTGGSSGIGLATAKQLASQGAEVCLVGRRQDALEKAQQEIGGRAWGFAADLGKVDQVEALCSAVAERWERLDGIVNNAGIATMATLEETTPEQWDEVFAVNARGPYQLIRGLVQNLRASSRPSIVNVSSTLAEKAIPGMAAYNASKAALNQMTRSAALELAPEIRVNAVMPAVVDTPIHASRGMSSEQVQGMGEMHPLGRVGTSEDIAHLVVFLLSQQSSWMSGAIIPVDGGMMAG